MKRRMKVSRCCCDSQIIGIPGFGGGDPTEVYNFEHLPGPTYVNLGQNGLPIVGRQTISQFGQVIDKALSTYQRFTLAGNSSLFDKARLEVTASSAGLTYTGTPIPMIAVLMAPYLEPSLVPVPGHPPATSTTPGQREVSFPLASFTFSYTPSDTPAIYIFEITSIIAPLIPGGVVSIFPWLDIYFHETPISFGGGTNVAAVTGFIRMYTT